MTRPEKTAVIYAKYTNYSVYIFFCMSCTKFVGFHMFFLKELLNYKLTHNYYYVQVTRLESNMVAYNAYIGWNSIPANLLAYWG